MKSTKTSSYLKDKKKNVFIKPPTIRKRGKEAVRGAARENTRDSKYNSKKKCNSFWTLHDKERQLQQLPESRRTSTRS
jgi:hypothetical protein